MSAAQKTPGRRLHDMWVNADLCTGSVYHWDDLSDVMRQRWERLAGDIQRNRQTALEAIPDITIEEINALPSKKGKWVSMNSNNFVVDIVRDAYRAGIAKAQPGTGSGND